MYEHADGSPAMVMVRINMPKPNDPQDKTFRPVHPTADGWAIGDPPGKLPLFGLPTLLTADRMFVVEGEKCVEAARSIGLTATTSSHGATSPHKTDWTPLAGREVVILPDNDTPGRNYAASVARILTALSPPARVKIVELPRLGEGEDIANVVARVSENQDPNDIARDIESLADATPYWEPPQTAPSSKAWRPFPVDVLPEPLRSFVAEGAAAIGCDAAMIALPALAVCAAVIGTTRATRLKGSWLEPPIIWSAIVSPSGTLKSPAQDYATRPLRDVQTQRLRDYEAAYGQYKRELQRYEADLKHWRSTKPDKRGEQPTEPVPPLCVRYVVADTTIEALAPILLGNPRGILLARDELAAWLTGFNQYKAKGGSDAASWLELHRAGTIIVDRKTGIPRTIYVPRAAVSVCGTVQPGTLRRRLTREFFEAGLPARLLLAAPPQRRKRWTDADVSPVTVQRFGELIDALLTLQHGTDERGELVPIAVQLAPDAKRLWVEFYDEFAGVQENAGDDDLCAAFAKIEGYAPRFALVFQLVRWAASPDRAEGPIDERSIAAAIRLARWFAYETERVYSMLRETDAERSARELADFIRGKGGRITARQLQQGPRAFRASVEVAEEALQALVDAGRGVWEPQPAGEQGGRPTRVFVLRPDGNGNETPANPEDTEVP
jgi:hypothetical protein